MYTKQDLKRFQAESLDDKYQRTLAKVAEWYAHWSNNVYVSFSGGKDSTVLADICAKWCENIGATLYLMFVDTGLEYPEIKRFVNEYAEFLRGKYKIDVVLDIVKPKMRFDEVIKKYGYPIISKDVAQNIYEGRGKPFTCAYQRFVEDSKIVKKYNGSFSLQKWKPLLDSNIPISHKCCYVMKKNPAKQYEKATMRKPLIATLAEESRLRETQWMRHGCNAFDNTRPLSVPMSFWTEQDVLQYIMCDNIPIASAYGDVIVDPITQMLKTTLLDRTGCIFCAFGCHREKPTRFEKLKITHPRQYEYCIGGGEYDENGIWMPNKQGLGLGHIFDELNAIYGDDFIKY